MTIVVYAMPGSSPQRVEEGVDGMVVDVAAAIAEDTLSMKLEEGEWSTLERLELAVLGRLLRRFVSKRFAAAAYPEFKSWTWTRPPPPPINATESQLNKALVLCSQAMLAPVLGARPLCGERLREVRAVADAEAEADASAAVVDVNLLLAFLAIRDGRFDEAMQRYRAAVARPVGPPGVRARRRTLLHRRPRRGGADAWLRGEERHCDRGRGATADVAVACSCRLSSTSRWSPPRSASAATGRPATRTAAASWPPRGGSGRRARRGAARRGPPDHGGARAAAWPPLRPARQDAAIAGHRRQQYWTGQLSSTTISLVITMVDEGIHKRKYPA